MVKPKFTDANGTTSMAILNLTRMNRDSLVGPSTSMKIVMAQFDAEELSTVTDAFGRYSFVGLPGGEYIVAEVIQQGWRQTFPGTFSSPPLAHTILLTTSSSIDGVNFGNQRLPGGSIHGNKWDDANGNGEFDEDESGLAGWTIYIDENRNGQFDANELSTVTDAFGSYSFFGLQGGEYIVSEVVQQGWRQTFPGNFSNPPLSHRITFEGPSSIDGVNFGNQRVPGGSIHGNKWNDINGNREYDEDEPGLAGWTIYIDENRNGQLDAGELSTVTDALGRYSFTGLLGGDYIVAEVVQAGWRQTFPGTFSDPPLTHRIIFEGPSSIDGVNFGNQELPTGSIHGSKWHDVNANRERDAAEFGLGGWTIYLDLDNDGQLDAGEPSTVTDESGNYWFTDVPSGGYIVREVNQEGWIQTAPRAGFYSIEIGNQRVENLDFGNFRGAQIHGTKWSDINGNGVRDPGEPGLAGWTIYIDRNNDGRFSDGDPTTVTMADGQYWFTGLPSGQYTIGELQQETWTQTYPNTAIEYFDFEDLDRGSQFGFGSSFQTVGTHGTPLQFDFTAGGFPFGAAFITTGFAGHFGNELAIDGPRTSIQLSQPSDGLSFYYGLPDPIFIDSEDDVSTDLSDDEIEVAINGQSVVVKDLAELDGSELGGTAIRVATTSADQGRFIISGIVDSFSLTALRLHIDRVATNGPTSNGTGTHTVTVQAGDIVEGLDFGNQTRPRIDSWHEVRRHQLERPPRSGRTGTSRRIDLFGSQ